MMCSNNSERAVTDLLSLFVGCLFWFCCDFILIVQRVQNPLSAPAICYALMQGFPNWGSRPLGGSRNDVQGLQRVYQFYIKYCIYYSFCSNCTYYAAYTIVTIVYAVLCVKLVYSLQHLMIVKNYCNCAKHHS